MHAISDPAGEAEVRGYDEPVIWPEGEAGGKCYADHTYAVCSFI